MKPMRVPVDAEQFPETIRVSALSLKMDSVFNRGTEMAAMIQNLRFKEGNGLDLRDLSCRVSLESEQTNVSNLVLKTGNSQLKMNLRAESGISDFGMETPIQLSIDGNIAGQDVLLFLPDSNDQITRWLSDKIFSLSGLVKGKVDQLNITRFEIGATDGFSLKSEGSVSCVTDMEKMAGELNLAFVVDRGTYSASLVREWGGWICSTGPLVINHRCYYLTEPDGKSGYEIEAWRRNLACSCRFCLAGGNLSCGSSLERFRVE